MSNEKKRDDRVRNFATIIYPESAPENFKEIIADWHIPAFLSPLHDKDVNPDGEIKKAHYHLMLMFQGPKSDEYVKKYFDEVSGVGIKRIASVVGMARYLVHMDNPEKYQYNRNDVSSFAGADYEELVTKSADEDRLIIELSQIVVEKDIDNVQDLFVLCLNDQRFDLIRQLTRKSSYWFQALCKANDYKKKKMLKSIEEHRKENKNADT